MLPRFQDDVAGEGVDGVQIIESGPAEIDGVAGARGGASGDAAEVIDENVVVLDATLFVAGDTVDDFDDGDGLDEEAGFFLNFAANALLQSLAELERPSGQRPLALERRVAALDEENAVLMEDDGSDADDGTVRILAGGHSLMGLPYSFSKTVRAMLKRPP